MLGMHPAAAEIGDFVMQIAVFLGAVAEGFIIPQGILLVERQGFAQFDLFGQDGIGLQSEGVGRKVGKIVLKEEVQIAVPLFSM